MGFLRQVVRDHRGYHNDGEIPKPISAHGESCAVRTCCERENLGHVDPRHTVGAHAEVEPIRGCDANAVKKNISRDETPARLAVANFRLVHIIRWLGESEAEDKLMTGISDAHWHGRSLRPSGKASNNTSNDEVTYCEFGGLQCRPDNDQCHHRTVVGVHTVRNRGFPARTRLRCCSIAAKDAEPRADKLKVREG